MPARPYQNDAVAAMVASLEKHGSALLHMATGTGKTFCMSEISRIAMQRGRVLTVANREVLVVQLARAQRQWLDVEPDIEMASMKANEGGLIPPKPVVVASIQTLSSGRGDGKKGRVEKFNPTEFSLINFDEAHRSLADSFLEVIQYFRSANPGIWIAGYTATAERGDKKSLGLVYNHTAFSYPMPKAINDGWLVPIKQRIAIVSGLELDRIDARHGDLPDDQVQAVMSAENAVRCVAGECVHLFNGKKTLVFTAGIEHNRKLCEVINALRPGTAADISSLNTPAERATIFEAFHSGRTPILVNCDIVSEGYDHPEVENIFMARPSRSRGRYAQAVGRATRPVVKVLDAITLADQRRLAIAASGKPHALVVDFTGHCKKHNLAMVVDLEADTAAMDPAVRERCRAILADGQWHETTEVIERVEREIANEQEQARAKLAAEKAQHLRKNRFQNAMDFRIHTKYEDVDPFAAMGIAKPQDGPWMPHRGMPATEAQINALRHAGMPDKFLHKVSFDTARKAFQRITWRRQRGLCTLKQSLWLTSHGYDGAHATFAQAMEIRDEYERQRKAGHERNP